jgi:hypothetical protein
MDADPQSLSFSMLDFLVNRQPQCAHYQHQAFSHRVDHILVPLLEGA